MKYILTIYLQDEEGVKSKRIGEYDSLNEAKQKQILIINRGKT